MTSRQIFPLLLDLTRDSLASQPEPKSGVQWCAKGQAAVHCRRSWMGRRVLGQVTPLTTGAGKVFRKRNSILAPSTPASVRTYIKRSSRKHLQSRRWLHRCVAGRPAPPCLNQVILWAIATSGNSQGRRRTWREKQYNTWGLSRSHRRRVSDSSSAPQHTSS